jgi:hypothetical protein
MQERTSRVRATSCRKDSSDLVIIHEDKIEMALYIKASSVLDKGWVCECNAVEKGAEDHNIRVCQLTFQLCKMVVEGGAIVFSVRGECRVSKPLLKHCDSLQK